jgi:hypothetical protein
MQSFVIPRYSRVVLVVQIRRIDFHRCFHDHLRNSWANTMWTNVKLTYYPL